MSIKAVDVKNLREKTGLGMMECKKALEESQGNLEEAITGNHTAMQRVFLGMGWDMWSLGIEDEELTKAKEEVRQDRKDAKKNIKKKPFVDGGDRDGDGIKEYRCTGISKSTGKRCKNKGEYGKKRRCYAHQ